VLYSNTIRKLRVLPKVKLTAEAIEGVVTSLLKRGFADAADTPDCHREWWEMCCSERKFVALAAPRGHAKSTAITFAYTLCSVLFRERKFVILVSDTEAQSSLFLGTIKRELTDNEDLRALFGVKTLLKDTETDCIVQFEDGHVARIIAKGSEQKLRGLNWAGTRPDLIVGDDMENDEIVLNKDRREKFRRWFTGALVPCLSKNGVIRLIGTILHMDSLLERYMPKAWQKTVFATDLKIQTDPKSSNWFSAKYRAHPSMDDFSQTLWPQYRNGDWLRREQKIYLEQGQGDVYSQEYLNNPIDDTNALFKKGDFDELKDEDKGKNLNYYISMDLATSKDNIRTDYTAFCIAGVDENNQIQVRHMIRQRMDTLEIVKTILELQKKWTPQFFIVEKGAITNSILPFLKVKMMEEDIWPLIHMVSIKIDKIQNTASIRGRMRAGNVKFDKEASWYQTLEQECIRFPRDRHDDMVDTLSLMGVAMNKFIEAPTKKQIEEQEYADEWNESGIQEQGRSLYTGY
jgi:predicted phage terminase large subunit-like protein